MLSTIWTAINGKKTMTGGALGVVAALAIIIHWVFPSIKIPQEVIDAIALFATIIFSVGLGHKAMKARK